MHGMSPSQVLSPFTKRCLSVSSEDVCAFCSAFDHICTICSVDKSVRQLYSITLIVKRVLLLHSTPAQSCQMSCTFNIVSITHLVFAFPSPFMFDDHIEYSLKEDQITQMVSLSPRSITIRNKRSIQRVDSPCFNEGQKIKDWISASVYKPVHIYQL